MSSRIIQIGNRNFLLGMTWHTHEADLSKAVLKAESEQFSADLGVPLNWACKRTAEDTHVQYGYATRPNGVKRVGKLFSLGAQLAATRRQPWLGTFQIDEDTWWYIAVRDGHTILPDGDVVGDMETIQAARENHSNFGDWNYEEGDISKIQELLEESGDKYFKIFPLQREPVPVSTIVIFTSVLSLLIGGYVYLSNLKKEEWELEHARLLDNAKRGVKFAQNTVNQVVNSDDTILTSYASPDEWINACNSLIRITLWNVQGWNVRDIVCDKQNMSVTYMRSSFGTVSNRPEGELAANGDLIVSKLALPQLPPAPDNRKPIDESRELFFAWAQNLGIKPTITSGGGNSLFTLPGQEKSTAVSATATKLDFSFSVNYWPDNLQLNSIPGLRVTSLKFDGINWLISGLLFGIQS